MGSDHQLRAPSGPLAVNERQVRNMKLACGTVLFRQHPLDRALETIREIGYEYVETQSVGPWCPHVDVTTDDPIRFADKVRAHGFSGVTALWMRNGTLISSDVCVEWAVRTLEWAHAAGIPVVNTGDGFKPAGMSDADAFRVYEARMGLILEACEKFRTHIAIEPHGTFSLTGDGLAKLMAFSDSPWLGVNYDACNIHRACYVESKGDTFRTVSTGSGENEADVLRRVAGRVVHVHAKDYIDGHCVALGDGNVKLDDCFKVLREAGYDGAISLETEGDESFEVSADYARRSLEYLKARF